MSKLFSDDAPDTATHPAVALRGPVIRNRKKHPLHPEEIKRRLREKAAADLVPHGYGRGTSWLLKLWRLDTDERQIRSLRGDYKVVCELRDKAMATGNYAKAWLELCL
jgi:hypothetical protein